MNIEYKEPIYSFNIINHFDYDFILLKKECNLYKMKIEIKKNEMEGIEDVLIYLYEKYSQGNEYIYEYKLIDYITQVEKMKNEKKNEIENMIDIYEHYLYNRKLCKIYLSKKIPNEICEIIMNY